VTAEQLHHVELFKIGNLGTEPAAARAEVGLDPSASDAELAAVQAYIATPGGSEMKAWLLHIASAHEVTVGWCLDLLLG